MKVTQVLARLLHDEGVAVVFTVLGDAVMECLAELDRREEPVLYHARHEAAALAMAAAYGRSTGEVGVCAVTCGPGLVNAGLSLADAARSGSPVVVLTGRQDDRTSPQYFNHESFVLSTGARYRSVVEAAGVTDAAFLAFDEARRSCCPVVLDVPMAVQSLEYDWPYSYEPSPRTEQAVRRIHPDPAAVVDAAGRISRSQRPVVIAGEGAHRSGARDAIIAFAARVGALVSTTLPVRGWFSGDPFNIGVAGLFSDPVATELLAESDCIVGIGASLNHYTIEGGYLFPEAEVVHIDTAPEALMGNGVAPACHVQADAMSGVEALSMSVIAGNRYRTAAVHDRLVHPERPGSGTEEDAAGGVDPRAFCALADQALPVRCAVVIGVGHFMAFPIMHMTRWRWPQLYTHYFGSIGQGLSASIGVAVGDVNRPVVVFEGDGGVMMQLQELRTIAHYGLPVLVVVMNNAALGSEYYKLQARALPVDIAVSAEVNFGLVARSLGCRGVTITELAQVKEAVQEFLAIPGPMVLDVRIARNVVSQPYRRLHFGGMS